MVLLMTIMMMSLLTLLVLTLLQAVFLYVKVSHQVLRSHQAFHQLEAAAARLAIKDHGAECLFTNENPNQIIALLSNHVGCSLTDGHHTYHYLIDDLGLYPCLHIGLGHQRQSSHHWLITIASDSAQQSILQFRIAKPSQLIACEDFKAHAINAGIISWRYLA